MYRPSVRRVSPSDSGELLQQAWAQRATADWNKLELACLPAVVALMRAWLNATPSSINKRLWNAGQQQQLWDATPQELPGHSAGAICDHTLLPAGLHFLIFFM
jgi:D-alanyl-D-alanine dipeptidase